MSMKSWLWRWYRRVRGVLVPGRVEREVADEMRFHLEMEARERMAHGEEAPQARRRARQDFGSVERFRAEAREQRWGHAFEVLVQDVRYAVRGLRQRPGFAAVILATLALGIGASTAILSVIDAVMLRPLPYADTREVVWIQTSWHSNPQASISPAEFLDYRQEREVFAAVGVYTFGAANLTGDGEPERVPMTWASAGLFQALGATPRLGRAFGDDEDISPAEVVVLGDGFWRRRFGADPEVIGRTLQINGLTREVIGVMPADFRLPEQILSGEDSALYLPLGIDPAETIDRGSHFLSGVARLAPGVTLERARAALAGLAARFAADFPGDYPPGMGFGVTAEPVGERVRGPVRAPIAVLAAAVGLLMLISCVNVANLLLARADRRSREFAMRLALGAGRGRIAGQVAVESLVLALLGGVAGVAVAAAATRAAAARIRAAVPWLGDVEPDGKVLLAGLGLSLATGLIFGLVPARKARQAELVEPLKAGARSVHGTRRGRAARQALVVGEIAIAVVLLVGAGLLARSFLALQATDAGFRTSDVVTTRLSLPSSAYPDDESLIGFFDTLVPRLEALPGVIAAGAVTNLPLATGLGDMDFEIEGRPIPEGEDEPAADWQVVTPGYFEAMGLRLLEGRAIGREDRAEAPGAVVINRTFAELHWPGESALGKRLRPGGRLTRPEVAEVVGVVDDVRHELLVDERRAQMYFAHPQFRFWSSGRASSWMTLVVHAVAPAEDIAAGIRAAVRALDPALPLAELRTMREVRGHAVALPRVLMTLVTAFSMLALALAAIGIYGVVSETVSQRIPELGIRMAFGATAAAIVRLVASFGARTIVAGLTLGLLGALATSRFLTSQLYGTSPTDPATLIAVCAVLAAVAALACYIPVRRAARTDPARLLRSE